MPTGATSRRRLYILRGCWLQCYNVSDDYSRQHRRVPKEHCDEVVRRTSARSHSSTSISGCLAMSGSNCPTTGYTGSLGFTFELWGASFKLDACVTPPGAAAASYSCSNIAPASTYVVPLSSDMLDANVPSTTGTNLQGCLKSGTACPSGFYPLISSSLQVQACRSIRQTAAAGGCNASYVPLCDMRRAAGGAGGNPQLTTEGLCAGTDTLGCITAAGATWQTCANLTSTDGYPVVINGVAASQYKFVVKIFQQGYYLLTSCAVASAQASTCNVAGTITDRE
jgi:hypothetical protein